MLEHQLWPIADVGYYLLEFESKVKGTLIASSGSAVGALREVRPTNELTESVTLNFSISTHGAIRDR